MSNKDAGATTKPNQAVKQAVKLIEDSFMDVSEMRETLGLTSYQYARQMIVTDRYGLGSSTIEVLGRTFVSREAVLKALEIRKARREEAEQTA